MRGAVWRDALCASVMQRAAHLLVFPGGDLLQEVGCALARRQPEAQRLEEGHHLLAGAVVHQAACRHENVYTACPHMIQRGLLIACPHTSVYMEVGPASLHEC